MNQSRRSTPAVSIVTVFLDTRKYLGEAVASVLEQSFTDWELLLVDDGSTDGTDELARQFASEDPRIRYLHHPGRRNRGISASRNLGLAEARADLLAQLDSDDVLLPCHLERHIRELDMHPEAAMVYGPVQRWYSWTGEPRHADSDFVARPLHRYDIVLPPPQLLPLMLQRKYTVPLGFVCRADAARAVGGYEDEFRGMYDDQVFFAKLALAYPVYVTGEWSYRYRRHPESIVSVVGRSDRKLLVRHRYLKWLEGYLRENRVQDTAVWDALRKEMWKVEHPRLADLAAGGWDLVRRVRRKVGKLLRRAD